jgi:hypothetical protein
MSLCTATRRWPSHSRTASRTSCSNTHMQHRHHGKRRQRWAPPASAHLGAALQGHVRSDQLASVFANDTIALLALATGEVVGLARRCGRVQVARPVALGSGRALSTMPLERRRCTLSTYTTPPLVPTATPAATGPPRPPTPPAPTRKPPCFW